MVVAEEFFLEFVTQIDDAALFIHVDPVDKPPAVRGIVGTHVFPRGIDTGYVLGEDDCVTDDIDAPAGILAPYVLDFGNQLFDQHDIIDAETDPAPAGEALVLH